MADQLEQPEPKPTTELVNLQPPSKLPSRPRKLRKLSPETTTTKPLPRPLRSLGTSTPQRSLSSEGEIENALKHLRNADPILAQLIDTHDPPTFDSFQTPFLALTKSILYQQLAFKAGTSIYSRFVALCGGEAGVTHQIVLSLSPQQLRQIGVSARKTSYLHDLARKYSNGILSDSSIIAMDDKTLNTMLTMVNGIGSWSVHMFMIFSLHRPDVLPVNDLGIRKGVHLLFGLEDLPRPSQMDQLCHKWRPYRSVASWYVWRFVEAQGVPSASHPPPPQSLPAPAPTPTPTPAPVADTSLEPLLIREISSLPSSPHQQRQPHFLDPINGIMNLG